MSEPFRMALDLDRIARLRDFLAAAQQLAADYTRGDPTWAGMPESKAAAESTDSAASPALLNELNGAYAFAQMRVQAVMEHAESIASLCGEGGPSGSLAIDALTRAAVETAARARWVLEDGLSVAAENLAISCNRGPQRPSSRPLSPGHAHGPARSTERTDADGCREESLWHCRPTGDDGDDRAPKSRRRTTTQRN